MQNVKNILDEVGGHLPANEIFKVGILFGFLFCIGIFSSTVSASPWDLDTTFGSGGKVVWSPSGNTESRRGSDMALQADGKIVMTGGSIGSGATTFMVVRFNSDGSVDTTFGNNGSTVISFGGTSELADSVAIQPDGRIVVGGRTSQPSLDIAIARLNSDGSLDATFDFDGKVTVDFTSTGSHPDYLSVIKVASDGKIVFAGQSTGLGTASYHKTIGRLNANGSLDTTFDGDGKLMSGNGSGGWEDLIIHPDGSMTLTGSSSGQSSSVISVSRFNSNGSIAWTWFRNIQPGCYMSLYNIAEQSDGKLVVVGSNLCKPVAFRINSNGTEDATFNSTPLNFIGQAFTVAVQADGKILATVGFDSHYDDGFSLVRYNADGTLDSGFGNAGIARIRVLNGYERAHRMFVQPDGKILIGGAASVDITSGYRFAMVRYRGASSVPPLKSPFDYDGDGRADVSVFRPSENKWFILRSSDSGVVQSLFGSSGDIPAPADFDGDGKADPAIYRPSTGVWWYLSSINGNQIAAQWGQSGDIPLPSDFDGDGKADYVAYRPSENKWYRLGSTGSTSNVAFGSAGDKPVIGDFDGDGKSDPAVYRPSTGVWWYAASGSAGAHRAAQFGISTDTPVPADFDGDGKTDFAVYRAADGVWHILNSSNLNYTAYQFGIATDKPASADYDGDGKADIAVFRASTGSWYILKTTAGFTGVQWGAVNDIPTQSSFIR